MHPAGNCAAVLALWWRSGGKANKHGWATTVCCFLQKALLWGIRMCAQNGKGSNFVLEHPPSSAYWPVQRLREHLPRKRLFLFSVRNSWPCSARRRVV